MTGVDRDAIVLGAGISGLVAASILSRQGAKRVDVVDNYDCLGGNHIDVEIGPYTFDIGSLIFQDDSPLLRHFPELLPLYVDIKPTWTRLTPQGRVTTYPVSVKDDVIAAGALEWVRIGASLLWARSAQRRITNAHEFARYWIGARFLKRSGLENYLERFYGLPAERIDFKFAESRMLWIKEHASLRTHLRRRSKPAPDTPPPNRQLARPRQGFSYLYQAARQTLEQRGVEFHLGAGISAIEKTAHGFTVETSTGCLHAERVISTLPLQETLRLCGLPAIKNLQTMTLISLFYSFRGQRGFSSAVLYNFSDEGSWKRLTVYSDFYGPAEDREFFAVEVNADLVGSDVETAHRDFRQHTQRNNLFDGDLVLEGSHRLEHAYPIYSDGADALATEAIAALKRFGIDSIGRQGRFDYQPTARDTTIKAERALQRS